MGGPIKYALPETEIVRMYRDQRRPVSAMAAEFGCSTWVVYKHLARLGVTRTPGESLRRPLEERFWAKVDKNGPVIRPELGACWMWMGGRDQHGYGKISINRKPVRATRTALALAGRGLTPDQDACHRCDNPPCVRESHLFPGTARDNIHDSMRKGRFRPRRTTCMKGHPLSEDNTIYKSNGNRLCKTCRSATVAAYRLSQKQHKGDK